MAADSYRMEQFRVIEYDVKGMETPETYIKGVVIMKLTPPKKMTFWVSVLLAVLGVIGYFVPSIPVLRQYDFWLLLIGYVVLFLGLVLKGF